MVLKYSKKYQKHQKELKEALNRVKEKFFAAKAENLHNKSNYEVIFSLEFLKLLKEALPSSSDFLSMRMRARREVVQTIQNLVLVESNWKGLVSQVHHEQRLVRKMFPKQLEKFRKDVSQYFSPSDSVTHKQKRQMYPNHKVIVFCEGLFKFIQDKNIPFFKDFSFDSVDNSKLKSIATEVSKNVSSSHFFKEIVKICMKKAVDNRVGARVAPDAYDITESIGKPFLGKFSAYCCFRMSLLAVELFP